jgi:glycosyltransferase involved in cell wall biosynthesis
MSFAIIIPAFNEARTIGQVLAVVRQVDAAREILVVDDGSTDGTADVVRAAQQVDPRLQLIVLPRNQGKAAAVVAGANLSHHDVLVLLDADLVGLRPEHIDQLIEPVLQHNYAMSSVVLRQGDGQLDWAHWPTPILSGQRCLRWRLFRNCAGLETARWSIEVAFNLHARQQRYRVRWIDWYGVGHVGRTKKLGVWGGVASIIAMWAHIGRYVVQQSLRPVVSTGELAQCQNAQPQNE